jgi:hypothetical protein
MTTHTRVRRLASAALAAALLGSGAALPALDAVPAGAATTVAAKPHRNPNLKVIRYRGKDGRTALRRLRDEGYRVWVKHSSMGDYVTRIGDVQGDSSHYWLYKVNGKLASVGAGEYHTKSGDRIEWRFSS